MSVHVVTGLVRFSYANVFKARAMNDGDEAKYSICLLIPKKDKATVEKIRAAIKKAVEEGVRDKWNGKKPSSLRLPLRDGDEERGDEHPEYKGMFFLNANSTRRPVIVDKDRNEILDPEEFYSGCWGRASFDLFAYDTRGNRGIGAGLVNVQKLKDDERFGGSAASADDDFGDDFDADDDVLNDF